MSIIDRPPEKIFRTISSTGAGSGILSIYLKRWFFETNLQWKLQVVERRSDQQSSGADEWERINTKENK